jgi:predicted DNA-binding transcriptional regulator AlpA
MLDDADDDLLIPDPEVRRRYGGISEMTLWRWDRDPTLGFPKPVRIRNRKYRRLSELRAWEIERAARRLR